MVFYAGSSIFSEGTRRNQGTHNILHYMHPSGHRVRFSSFSQFTLKLPVRWTGGLTEARYENYLPACHLSRGIRARKIRDTCWSKTGSNSQNVSGHQ